MLSVMCKYGEEEDIARVLDNMRTYNFVPSRITFNTLLTRFIIFSSLLFILLIYIYKFHMI